jgi:hypothetical protein
MSYTKTRFSPEWVGPHKNFRPQPSSSAPTSAGAGHTYFNTTDDTLYVRNANNDGWRVAGIGDGKLTNAHISGSAAIALSKLATDPLDRANHTGTQEADTISDLTTAIDERITAAGLSATATDHKDPVRLRLNRTAAGMGAFSPGGNQIDRSQQGVTLDIGERVFVVCSEAPEKSGIYITTDLANGFLGLTRATDADANDEVTYGMTVKVLEGTYAKYQYVLANIGSVTVGTTELEFVEFPPVSGLTGASNQITITGLQIGISGSYAGQSSITTLGTISSGTWNGTVVGLAYGGLGVNASNTSGKKTARDNLKAVGVYAGTITGDGSATEFSSGFAASDHGLNTVFGVLGLDNSGNQVNLSFSRDGDGDVTITCEGPLTAGEQVPVFLLGL